MHIVSTTANQRFFYFHVQPASLTSGQHAAGLSGDFRADTVAREYQNLLRHRCFLVWLPPSLSRGAGGRPKRRSYARDGIGSAQGWVYSASSQACRRISPASRRQESGSYQASCGIAEQPRACSAVLGLEG